MLPIVATLGITSPPGVNGSELDATKTGGDPRVIRRAITNSMLTRQHLDPISQLVVPQGTAWRYANENFFILGAAIEQMADGTYEDLMQSRLLGPLGITTADFGVPVDKGQYQPHGHYRAKDYSYDLIVLDKQLHPPQAPAGALYCTIEDWLKFCRLHLTGSEGSLTLSPATRADLHTPFPRQHADDADYALGWGVKTDSAGTYLDHNGSIGTYYSRCFIYLDAGIAVAAVANCGGRAKESDDASASYGTDAVHLLLKHLFEKARSKEFGGDLVAGSIFLNQNSESLAAYRYSPAWLIPDDGPEGVPPLGVGYFPVSLYQSDVQNRSRAAEARAPRILNVHHVRDGLFNLRFRSDPGYFYQLFRVHDLRAERRELLSEFLATDEVTEVEIDSTPGARSEFFQVGDLEE